MINNNPNDMWKCEVCENNKKPKNIKCIICNQSGGILIIIIINIFYNVIVILIRYIYIINIIFF